MPLKGYRQTDEHKKNAQKGNFQKGHSGYWNKENRPHSEETKQKMRHPHKKHKKYRKYKRGEMPLSQRKNISKSLKGAKNPSWRGGISFLSYSVNWTETFKRSIRERDKYVCQICNKQQGDKAHPVHHIDYNKLNNNPDNLITLCSSCHGRTNHNRKYWVNYFFNKFRDLTLNQENN